MTDSGQHDEPDSQRTPRPRFDALERVLAERQMPLENQRFLRPVVAAIGIAQYELTASYIKAIRADGGPDLHIYYGYTGGFVSEQEVVDAVGDRADRWLYAQRDLWSVGHPVNKIRTEGGSRSGGSGPVQTPVCPTCFIQLPATGVCDSCE